MDKKQNESYCNRIIHAIHQIIQLNSYKRKTRKIRSLQYSRERIIELAQSPPTNEHMIGQIERSKTN